MRNGNWGYLGTFFSHGLTAALTVYLAVRGGDWLDRRLGTSPFLLITLVLLVVAANLRLLIKDMLAEADRQDARGGRGGARRRRPGEGTDADRREDEDR